MIPFVVCYEFSSYPRLLIEVFTRKNFGPRYFYLSKSLGFAIVLALIPYFIWRWNCHTWVYYAGGREHESTPDPVTFWTPYIAGYVYLLAFVFFCFKRWLETRKFEENEQQKSTIYSGSLLLFFDTLGRPKTRERLKKGNISIKEFKTLKFNSSKLIECFLEPAPFFILGIVLIFLNQSWGYILLYTSIIYSFSYIAAYWLADEDRQDLRDKMLSERFAEKEFEEILQSLGKEGGPSRRDAPIPPKNANDDYVQMS